MLKIKPGLTISKVAAIVGGYSREQLLDSSPWIIPALRELGLEVGGFSLTSERLAPDLLDWKPDVVWPMGLGAYAEDGKLQGFIETLLPGTPYVGSGVAASALGMDKEHTQAICQALGLVVPKTVCFVARWHPHGRTCRVSSPCDADFLTSDAQPNYEALCQHMGPLLVVKPDGGGASDNLALVESQAQFEAAFTEASRFGLVLVQEYVRGGEYAVCVLDNFPRPLPVCQILGDLHDTASKLSGASYHISPSIDEELTARLQQAANALHFRLGCHGFSRVDLKVDRHGRIVILEINTNPGVADAEFAVYPNVCKAAGLSYREMIRLQLLTAFAPRWREVPRVDAAAAVPFPEELQDLLPGWPAEATTSGHQRVALTTGAEPPVPTATFRHAC